MKSRRRRLHQSLPIQCRIVQRPKCLPSLTKILYVALLQAQPMAVRTGDAIRTWREVGEALYQRGLTMIQSGAKMSGLDEERREVALTARSERPEWPI